MKFGLLGVTILFVGNIYSQNYIRMIDTANTWDVFGGGITTNGQDGRYTDEYRFIGDTIINSIKYSKLYSNRHSTANSTVLQFVCPMREDTVQKKIYRQYGVGTSASEELIYNFSLKKADSVIYYDAYGGIHHYIRYYKVDSVNVISFAGKVRKKLCISDYYYEDTHLWSHSRYNWIEGIGYVRVQLPGLEYILGPLNQGNELLCFWKSGQMLYQNPKYSTCLIVATDIAEAETNANIIVYPSPSNGVFNIQSLEKITEIQILNFFGTKIYEQAINHMGQASNTSSFNDLLLIPINLSKEPNGIYFLFVASDKGVIRKKFVIRK
jgi:hypothetical protein